MVQLLQQFIQKEVMSNASLYKAPGIVLEKLGRLLKTLQASKKVYEQNAFRLNDRQLRLTLLGHAQECNQYAKELASQIEILGGESERDLASHGEPAKEGLQNKQDSERSNEQKEAMRKCTKSGESTLLVYTEVLNEPSLHENMRKMIRYQINGLLHSFSQLSLLNSSLT
jgi:uncharacterized protein (TIGR02284 family)